MQTAHNGQSEHVAVGDRVQVFNPGPMSVGVIVTEPTPGHSYPRWVRVAWDDGGESWSRYDLLRKVEAS